jgi:hypothetical protein
MLRLLLLLGAALALASPAMAEDKPASPDGDAAARICEAYGPGYQIVPETGICIKIDGHVDVSVTVRGSSGAGNSGK